MTKEVMLTIRGLQFDQEAENEEIETVQWDSTIKKGIRIISCMKN